MEEEFWLDVQGVELRFLLLPKNGTIRLFMSGDLTARSVTSRSRRTTVKGS